MSLPLPILRVSETFFSVQGEGTNVGRPSHFLRLGTCNLRCTFCDTRYTWDWTAYDRNAELHERTIEELARDLGSARRLVVTGGEPLLQQEALSALLTKLDASVFVEVETNGTLAPLPILRERVRQWNVSPKLSNSGEPRERRIKPKVLATFARLETSYLKLVVESEERIAEAITLLEETNWPRERALLMPQAETREELAEREELVAAACARHGVRYSPRLHVQLWGQRRGV